MIRAARDAQKELDLRTELKLYLDEPLYEGDLLPMSWWKVVYARTKKFTRTESWIDQRNTLSSPRSNRA